MRPLFVNNNILDMLSQRYVLVAYHVDATDADFSPVRLREFFVVFVATTTNKLVGYFHKKMSSDYKHVQ